MIGINDIAKKLSEENDCSINDNKAYLELVISTIKDYVESWEKVNLNWFGRFSLVARAGRNWSNPFSWAPIKIKARTSLKFEVASPYHKAITNINI